MRTHCGGERSGPGALSARTGRGLRRTTASARPACSTISVISRSNSSSSVSPGTRPGKVVGKLGSKPGQAGLT